MNREDIEVKEIRITETFRYGEKVFHGLEELRSYSITGYSDNMGLPPFVVRQEESYPCFDSSDSMYEDRSYQAYFLTMDEDKAAAICAETRMCKFEFREKGIEPQYPVMEPQFNMSRIQAHHLPYIYYHGDGDWMEIVQDKNAQNQVTVEPRSSDNW